MIDLSNNTVRQVGLLYRYMMRAIDHELSAMDIGSGRFSYIFMLYIKEGITQQEMAYRLQADKAAVARTLAQMEEQGYVTRSQDERDRRITRVHLTEKSKLLRPQLEKAVEEVIRHMQAGFSEENTPIITEGISSMLASLDDHYHVSNKNGARRPAPEKNKTGPK